MPDTKACTKCGAVKPLDEFPVGRRMRDGHYNQCATCQRAWHQAYCASGRRRRVPTRKRAVHPSKTIPRQHHLAHVAVMNALSSGKLVRLPCEICGNRKSEAHHEDYERKLDVRWLCRTHHMMRHRVDPELRLHLPERVA